MAPVRSPAAQQRVGEATVCVSVQLLRPGRELEVRPTCRAGFGDPPLFSGMGRRSCQSKVGDLSTPVPLVGSPPPVKSSGHGGGHVPPVGSCGLRSSSPPAPGLSQHPWSLRESGPGPGGLVGPCPWASFVRHGLGLPCPAWPAFSLGPPGPGFEAGGGVLTDPVQAVPLSPLRNAPGPAHSCAAPWPYVVQTKCLGCPA